MFGRLKAISALLPKQSIKNFSSRSQLFQTSYYSKTPIIETFAKPGIRRQLLFGSFTIIGITLFSAAYTNIDVEERVEELNKTAIWRFGRSISNVDLEKDRRMELVRGTKSTLTEIKNTVGGEVRLPLLIAEAWVNLTEAQRTMGGIILVNSVVFLAWQIKRFQPAMARSFMHNPLMSKSSTTMITACFSHKSLLHFGFNSLALYSIGSAASEWMSRPNRAREESLDILRSTSRYEFLSFFIACGLFASLISHIYSIKFKLPRINRQMMSKTTFGEIPRIAPSLGASGAIYGCLSITAFAFPEASVSLIFLPFIPIPIMTAYYSMIALDIIGLLRGWRLFDHAAHLGGAGFGFLYFWYGAQMFDEVREGLLEEEDESSPR